MIGFNAASAQTITRDDITKLTATADAFLKRAAVEKLYIQFDRPNYAIGDTIWFKAYLLSAADLTPSLTSGILYAELVNDSNKVVQRLMLPVARGASWGNIAVDPKVFSEGGYTLRAYTNWMRNFGEAYVFKQKFYFADPSGKSWLVSSRFNLIKEDKNEKAKLLLQFNVLNKQPVILKDLELNIQYGDGARYKNKVQTKLDGTVDIDFMLKSPVKKFTVTAREMGVVDSGHKVIIPISINRPENIDLQFMPEGGSLVAGIPAHIGFKAINEDGKAADVEGVVYDSKQQPVAQLKSAYNGIGAFDMIPNAGEIYTAQIKLPGGIVKTYSLPLVQTDGTALKISATAGTDSLAIIIAGIHANGSYYLAGQANGVVCYSAIVNLHSDGVRIKIATAGFPTGIARFTLLNAARQPLNERLVFVNHHDFLKADVRPNRPVYAAGDSVAMQISVTDKDGRPVAGNFSMAITDDSQVKIDSIGAGDIISRLLLTSDLKGYIEAPGYYFQPDADGSIKRQLDNLLLTQGWVGYNWKDVFAGPFQPSFPAEKEFIIRGRVTNVFNKRVANSHVLLFSKRPPLVIDSVTNKDGRFQMRNIIPLDTPIYLLQARNKRGKSFNVDLVVDEFKPPLFATVDETAVPWYVNSSNAALDFVKGNIALKAVRDTFKGSGHILKEVKITAKKFIKNSQNPNGAGNADVVIDEKELEKAGKKTFLDLLTERVPGFHEGFFLMIAGKFNKKAEDDRKWFNYITEGGVPSQNINWYFVKDEPVKIIVDGVSLFKVYGIDGLNPLRDIKEYLTSHSAEDIKGIEVSHSSRYGMKYIPMDYSFKIGPADITYIEITTRAGSGPVMPYTPGTYLHKPMPFSLPKQFYQPKYTVKNKDAAPNDYRPTIFWNPNIITDRQGKATASFYSSGKKGTYTLVLEGTDKNGNLGSYRQRITLSGK